MRIPSESVPLRNSYAAVSLLLNALFRASLNSTLLENFEASVLSIIATVPLLELAMVLAIAPE